MRLAQLTSGAGAVRTVPGPRALDGVLTGSARFQIHLQPIVELATGEFWGVEALARFPGHPQPGPDAWFGTAVRRGVGPQLERVALRMALDLLPSLPQDLRLTVNLSARALLEPAVQEMLRRSASASLLVELTEHEQVTDYSALLRALEGLRTAGVGLCIDDFGAGHSSLRHVLQLEPDVLKLDLSLVQGVGECPRRQALVESMLGFCRSTGSLLVAEGVEQGDDLDRLVRLGVGHAQGWFLARPATPAVLLPMLLSDVRPTVLGLP